jgi:ribosomal-protein-alanine N-acetyltransferase
MESYNEDKIIDKITDKIIIRWMVRKDLPEVIDIERKCFEYPWAEGDFIATLRQRNCIGMVAEYQNRVAGFMVYEVPKNRIHLLNIAVSPEHQRSGFASQMIKKLTNKLITQGRSKITVEIRETNLPALLCFKSVGFRATVILKNFYEKMNEDAYSMQYTLKQENAPQSGKTRKIRTQIVR